MKKLFVVMSEALRRGQDLVLVSVVASSGSTPRGAGARMLVSGEGRLVGTIGGGAVEYHCIQAAIDLLGSFDAVEQTIALNREENADLGMVCGGRVEVHFFPISGGDRAALALCSDAAERFEHATPFWLLTPLQSGMPLALWPESRGTGRLALPTTVTDRLGPEPEVRCVGEDRWFCEQIQQVGNVYIFGGGHVAQALVPVLTPLGFPCIVLEDREEFADPSLFPGARQVRLVDMFHLDEQLTITEDDYVCIMTRGHENDLLVEQQILRTPARYLGVIGSARKTAKAFRQLLEMGFVQRDLDRVVNPIGLPIGGRSPEEIAVSIAAQLIQYRSSGRNDFLRLEDSDETD